ncbi:alcohol dehydrogenase catalytic domain-containing protein [Cellulosilyticum ruminicola]|uniref:alcohol dehydrogenase catalytic domain-containing protein n=1 Tax=Cellulosilyticum ruminicola TaxID=425254 RepID=UPI000ABC632A
MEEIGKEVTKVKKGDRVIVPFPVSCGHCFFCNHCLYSQENTWKSLYFLLLLA